METMFQTQTQQCPAEGNNNFPQPAGYGLINATVYEVILHHNKGGLTFSLVPVRAHVLLRRAAIQPGSHWPALLHGVAHFFPTLVSCQMHDFVFAFVHKAPVGTFLQSGKLLQNGSCALSISASPSPPG